MDSKARKVAIASRVVVIMGFVVLTNAAFEGFVDSYDRCAKRCPETSLSGDLCLLKCIPRCWTTKSGSFIIPLSLSGDKIQQADLDRFSYCSLGCTLNACAGSMNDPVKVHGCLKRCTERVCKI